MENKESLLESFNRAYGDSETTAPLMTKEQEKEENIDITTSFNRAFEESAVDLQNAPMSKEDESYWSRLFEQPYQRAIDRQVAVFERMASTSGQQTQFDPNVAKAELEEQYRNRTNLPSVLLQTATNPISLGFDVASQAILIGAEGAFSLIPEDFKADAAQAFKDFAETKAGQLAINAAAEGAETWKEFKQSNPNEAANLTAFFEKSLVRGTGPLVKNKVVPMKLKDVGLRTTTEPLAGGDRDVYNILFEGTKKTPEQTANTTAPMGVKGVQEVLATAEELELVDLAKAAGVNGSKTMQENLNSLNAYMTSLDDNLIKLLRRNESRTNWAELDVNVRQNVKAQFDAVVESNPSLFSSKAAKQEVNKLYSEFMSILDEQGGTLEGLLVARRMFDDRVKRMGISLDGSKLNSKSLAARAVREGVNDTFLGFAPEGRTMLEKMSKLYNVLDTVTQKASKEAKTSFGRYISDLGLDNLVGDTAASKVINAGYVLGVSVAASPYYVIKKMMLKPTPAKGRAKVAYVLRDIKREIAKGLDAIKDPVKKQSLLKDRRTVYAALDAAAKQYSEEMEEEQKNVR
jgi:hypothetical protein